jgi:hypothetical protein
LAEKIDFSLFHPNWISGHNMMLDIRLRQEFDARRKIILSQSHLFSNGDGHYCELARPQIRL